MADASNREVRQSHPNLCDLLTSAIFILEEIMETNVCKICGVEKPISQFDKNKRMKKGYINQCRTCVAERLRKSRERRRPKTRICEKCGLEKDIELFFWKIGKKHTYLDICPDCREKLNIPLTIKCTMCGEEKNIELFPKKKGTFVGKGNACKECRSKKDRKYRNKERTGTIVCRKCNVEKPVECFPKGEKRCKECKNIYRKNLIQEIRDGSPLYKFISLIRKHIGRTLRHQGKVFIGKGKLLGVESPETFHEYFDPLMKPGMTYKNHGKVWHYDHIIPCALFDYEDLEQIMCCFHYTNLQPLYTGENMSKQSLFEGVRYFYKTQPRIENYEIAPKSIIEAINKGEKVDFWTHYGKLPELQENIKLALQNKEELCQIIKFGV